MIETRPESFEERWRRRVKIAVAIVLALFLLLHLELRVLPRNLWLGLGLTPLLNFLVFSEISRWCSGERFRFRLHPGAKTSQEVLDLLFTVVFVLSTLLAMYSCMDDFLNYTPTGALK